MVTDEVGIFNLALNAVGTRSNVVLPTEKSREAEVCRLWFGPVRDQVLRAAAWPSCKAWKRLALLKERDDQVQWSEVDPNPEYTYAYSVPSDMLAPRYLAGFQRFSLETFTGNKLAINTNVAQAVLCYTKRQEVISLWDVSLQMAIAYGLAAYIAMPLTGKAQRAQNALNQANQLIMDARSAAANDSVEQLSTVPDWIAVRGYGQSFIEERYIYPTGSLFSAGQLGV